MSGISDRNPYVGPRPIQQGEAIYGRSREIRELYNRFQARRIVVLHSPSGAGKSSLVQAGLIPKLKEGNFDVWKPVRVNLDPHGLDGVPEGVNRYLLSAMSSLEEELPADRRRSPAQLADLDFRTYLNTRPRRKQLEQRSVALIFDQFEEILTSAPRAIDAKLEFFSVVGEVLDKDKYWALFVVREDFLAAFEPYRDRVPTQMSVTFRLDFLGLEGAREAAEQPALLGGRTFPGVDQLIRDLSTIRAQQPDGSFVTEAGIYVEPVQLQVVCHRLWAALPATERSIEAEHIARYAGVSESLGDYYAQAVQKVAAGDLVVERRLREWIGSKLIVEGNRSQVRQESQQSSGLENSRISQLLDSYLVRSEHRAGANWFELSHDRLVEPVRTNNAAWERAHLHAFQVQARLWEKGRRPAGLLLSVESLPSAVEWARQNSGLMTAGEQEFLALSRELRVKEHARRRRLVGLATSAASAALAMGLLAWWALSKERAAEAAEVAAREAWALSNQRALELARLNEESRQQLLALKAQTARDLVETPGKQIRGLSMALDAHARVAGATPSALTNIVEGSLLYATQSLHDAFELPGHQANIVSVSFASDGQRLVSLDWDHDALLWAIDATPTRLLGPERSTPARTAPREGWPHAEFSPQGDRLLIVDAEGRVELWDTFAGGVSTTQTIDPGCEVSAAAYSPTGEFIAFGCRDAQLCVWVVDGRSVARCEALATGEAAAAITALEFMPDGARLVAVHGADASLIEGRGERVALLRGHEGPITTLAISPDAAWIATGGSDRQVRLWSGDSGVLRETLEADQGPLTKLVFAGGARLLGVGTSSTPVLWQLDAESVDAHPTRGILAGHGSGIADAAASSDGKLLATVGYDQTLRLWVASSGQALATLEAPRGLVSVEFSPDGKRIATGDLAGSGETMVRVWDVEPVASRVRIEDELAVQALVLSGHGELAAIAEPERIRLVDVRSGAQLHELAQVGVTRLSFSPLGRELAAANAEGWTIWDVETGAEYETRLPATVTAVAFSADGMNLAIVDGSDDLRLWLPYADERAGVDMRAEAKAPQGRLRRENAIVTLAFSSKGALAGARLKGNVEVWDAEGNLLLSYDEPNVLLGALAFSPTGRYLAVATKQKWVWVFDLDAGTRLRLEGAEANVRTLAFAPDERRLVSGSATTLTAWNLELGVAVATVGRHAAPITSAAYSSDGEWIVGASADGRVIEWAATPERRRELACDVVAHSPVAYAEALTACE